MENKRQCPRTNCYARVNIGNFENIGYIQDFSKTGVKIHATSVCTYKDGTILPLKIIENNELNIGEVCAKAKLVWHTVSSSEILYGYHLIGFDDKDSQENYKLFLDCYKKAFRTQQ